MGSINLSGMRTKSSINISGALILKLYAWQWCQNVNFKRHQPVSNSHSRPGHMLIQIIPHCIKKKEHFDFAGDAYVQVVFGYTVFFKDQLRLSSKVVNCESVLWSKY